MRLFWNIVAGVFLFTSAFAQQRYSISVTPSYTNTATLYSPYYGSSNVSFDNNTGIGIDIREKFEEDNLIIGLSAEYLSLKQQYKLLGSPAKDTYSIIPIEANGFFIVPFNTNTLQWSVGGGVGMYVGKREFVVNGITATNTETKTSYGVQVVSTFEVTLTDYLSIKNEIKFRDVLLETTETFHTSPNPDITSGTPYQSELHVDGIMLGVGLVAKF